jgi:MFS family permease
MMGYSICFAATMPLVNSVLLVNVQDGATQSKVFIWAPVAWALVGYFLTGWRNLRKTEGDGSDCLVLGGVLSLAMMVACLFLPATPPANQGGLPIVDAFSKLSQPDFLVFILASMAIAGMMQFYFLGSARFMMDKGISGKNVPATMGIAQAAQALATLAALGMVLDALGFRWTLVLGAACWVVMYAAYTYFPAKPAIVGCQALHGLAYVMFMIVGQIYAGSVGPEIPGSMQALIFAATTGVGIFLGTQLAGIVMDKFSVDGQFQWQKIWMVPLLIVLVGTLVLAGAFKGSVPPKPAPATTVASAR